MLITQQGPTLRLFKHLERELTRKAPFADIAQKWCDVFYETFEQSVVLVRLFVALPFETLPSDEQAFARAILTRRNVTDPIMPTTPVMTLLGTRGVHSNWGNRQISQNYRALPLVSTMFVESMPMTAQLFRVLGANVESPRSLGVGVTEKAWGAGRAGFFYVENAKSAVDMSGRKIVGAQAFVEEYGVHTVFGMARAFRDELFFVQLIFCRHFVSRERAREFLPLAATLRGTIVRAMDANNIFSQC